MKTIAIGVGENENIIQACHIFKEKHPKTELKLIYKDDDLVKAVLDDKIDGVVRGSLPASNIMKELKEHYPNLSRATYVNGNDYEFLLSPVGIDEGVSVEDKFEIAMNCCDFLKKLGKTSLFLPLLLPTLKLDARIEYCCSKNALYFLFYFFCFRR